MSLSQKHATTPPMTDDNAPWSDFSQAALTAWHTRVLAAPVHGLMAAANQLQGRLDDPLSLQLVREVEAAAHAMSRLLEPMTTAGAPTESFTLPQLFSQAVASLSALARSRGVRLTWGVPPAAQGAVAGHPRLLLAVLFVLLDDALRQARGGDIRLQAMRPGAPTPADRMAISLSDTAPPSQPPPHAAMLDAMVSHLGGTMLWQHTEHGRTCTLLLPLPPAAPEPVQGTPQRGTPDAPPSLPRTARSRCVLLVDDYSPGRTSLAEVLRLIGHEVVTAADGPAALALHAGQPFDVVLMDLQMPRMDGLETARRLRQAELQQHLPRVPIYAMTAFSPHAVPSQARQADFDGCIAKPVELEALLRLLDSLP